MNNLFTRKYRVNYATSFDGGETFAPGSIVVQATSVYNAERECIKSFPDNKLNILSAHPLSTFAGRVK